MAARTGFEPVTSALTVQRSTIELPGKKYQKTGPFGTGLEI